MKADEQFIKFLEEEKQGITWEELACLCNVSISMLDRIRDPDDPRRVGLTILLQGIRNGWVWQVLRYMIERSRE